MCHSVFITWRGFSASTWRGAPQPPREPRAHGSEWRPLGHTHRICLLLCLPPWASWEHRPAVLPLLGRGLVPLHRVPRSSIGLFMWEVTTHFSTTSQAAGLNVTVLLRANRGHGTSSVLLSLWESHRSHHRSKGLDPGHRGALGISFCGLNKI